MYACNCILSGTESCKYCPNNPEKQTSYTYNTQPSILINNTNTNNDLQKLIKIIYKYDELIGRWINGERFDLLDEEECEPYKDGYELSDHLRNQAIEIITKLMAGQ